MTKTLSIYNEAAELTRGNAAIDFFTDDLGGFGL
jgi:hypothetical protein